MANNYDGERVVQLKHLDTVVARINNELGATFRSASVSGNTISFFNTKNGSGSAAFSFNLPEALFLSQINTTLVNNFIWSALTYPNSVNPNLDGKAVLVMAVRDDDENNPTITYSFVDMSKLIDIYTPADKSVNINGYSVAVNISDAANNILSIADDGLFAVNKVNGAVQGNLAIFGASGLIVDGGMSLADISDEIAGSKVDKVSNAVQGNLPVFGVSGAVVDSGVTFASDTDINNMIANVLGS